MDTRNVLRVDLVTGRLPWWPHSFPRDRVIAPAQAWLPQQYSLGKPVGIPREKPVIPGHCQPTQVHQRPLHTGHVLSWEGEGGVFSRWGA